MRHEPRSVKFYEGHAKPISVVGVHCCKLAMFAEKYRGWHSYGHDRATKRAVDSLARRGAIVVDEATQQFKWHC